MLCCNFYHLFLLTTWQCTLQCCHGRQAVSKLRCGGVQTHLCPACYCSCCPAQYRRSCQPCSGLEVGTDRYRTRVRIGIQTSTLVCDFQNSEKACLETADECRLRWAPAPTNLDRPKTWPWKQSNWLFSTTRATPSPPSGSPKIAVLSAKGAARTRSYCEQSKAAKLPQPASDRRSSKEVAGVDSQKH